ncbi:hypothetical protein BDR05DRAFT_96751 [Suillus weaverae]|nr:hypothetical protein BDR05DRAFT_96751 [Suillus weaverae]
MLNQSSLQHYVLKCRLNKQKLTHNTAGEFLHTVKTLMAKLKASDWGALSESTASHRHKFFSPDCPTFWRSFSNSMSVQDVSTNFNRALSPDDVKRYRDSLEDQFDNYH